MTKALFVSQSFLPDSIGGAEVYAANLAGELGRGGDSVSVVRRQASATGVPTVQHSTVDGVPVVSLVDFPPPSSPWAIEPAMTSWARRYLADERVDILHLFLFPGMLPIVQAARALDIPIVATSLDFGFFCGRFQLRTHDGTRCDGRRSPERCTACQLESFSSAHRTLYSVSRLVPAAVAATARRAGQAFSQGDPLLSLGVRTAIDEQTRAWQWMCANVDAFIAPSRFMRDQLHANGVAAERIHHLPYGVAVSPASKSPHPGTVRFAFLGRFHPSKGAAVLLDAFSRLEDRNVRLDLYGPGDDTATSADARIHFHGAVDRSQVGALHTGIDVLVVPSLWYENAPLVVLEALRCGTPVIASNVEGISEFVTDGVNGLLFEPGDSEGLLRALALVSAEPELRARLTAGAANPGTMEAHARAIRAIYHSLGRTADRRVS